MKTSHLSALLIACAAGASSMAAQLLAPDALSETERSQSLTPKAKGSAVLRAQVMLDRAHFSSGEIDAAYGRNLRTAISGYQKANGLPATGLIDASTWAHLNTDKAPILLRYTILDADVAGPFSPIPAEWADKARMTALGYASAQEALSEKFHASPKLIAQLNPGKAFDRAGEEIVVPNVAMPSELPKAVKVIVDGKDHTLSVVDARGNADPESPHLHFAIFRLEPQKQWKGSPVNPYPLLGGTARP